MSTAPPATPATPLHWYQKVWADLVKAEHATVSEIEKVAAKVPEVESAIDQYGPEIGQLISIVNPAAGKLSTIAVNLTAVVGKILADGGSAAMSGFTNQGVDATLLTDLKNIWPSIENAVKTATAPPPAAPAPAAEPQAGG